MTKLSALCSKFLSQAKDLSSNHEEINISLLVIDRSRARIAELAVQQQGEPSEESIHEFSALAPLWWICFEQASIPEKKLLLRDLLERIIAGRGEVEIVSRVNFESFLPKDRELAATRLSASFTVVSTHQTEPLYKEERIRRPLRSCLMSDANWRCMPCKRRP